MSELDYVKLMHLPYLLHALNLLSAEAVMDMVIKSQMKMQEMREGHDGY